MNRRLPGPSLLIVCCGALILLSGIVSLARAQSAGTGSVPSDVKTATNIAPHKETLQQYIARQIELLTGDDPVAQAQARDALVKQVETAGGTIPSAAYLDAYSEILNTAIAPVLAPDTPMRTRLNGAIVVARVAERAEATTRLLPAVLTILGDKADPVVLWGIKAARWILPAVMKNQILPQNQKLLTAIVPATKAHAQGPLSGAIVREAYDAVSLDVAGNPERAKRVDNTMIARVIPEMHGLMALRVEQYRKSMPAEPSAELRATLFLSSPRVWPLHKPEQQVQSVQLMSDLLWLAAQHAAEGKPSPEREQLPQMIQRTASALAVIPAVIQNPATAAALKPATEIGPTTPVADIKNRVQPVFAALKANDKFKALNPPPMLGAAAAAAAAPDTPTSGPTTLPGQGPATAPVAAPGKPAPDAAAKPAAATSPRGAPAPAPPPGAAVPPQPRPPAP